MEILRVPPYELTVDYAGLSVDTDHVLRLFDSRSGLMASVGATSDGSGDITFTLPDIISKYDAEYQAVVYEGTVSSVGGAWTYDEGDDYYAGYAYTLADVDQTAIADTDIAVEDSIKVVRPYLVPADITPDGESVATYTTYERLARTSIDTVVAGFYLTNTVIDAQGMGTDRLYLGGRVNKLISVVQNNELLFVTGGSSNLVEYTLDPDRNCLIVDTTDVVNLYDSRPSTIPAHNTDYDGVATYGTDFLNGYNYSVRVVGGWTYVPQDIKDATQLLVEDLACQSPNYIAKYVREYETKDFRVDIHRPAFAGTGNMTVDKILDKYIGETLYNGLRVL